MGTNGISDYASQYWDSLRLRHTYTWSQGIQELTSAMSGTFYQRQPQMMLDRPQVMLDSISGPSYVKHCAGTAYYNPPCDALDQPGVSGRDVTATILTAAALGAAGVRLYYFDNPKDERARANAPIGSYFQSGASPTANDQRLREIWAGIRPAASILTGPLQSYILSEEVNSPAYGPNIITAAREGSRGRLLLIINGNDWERSVSVDFAPFSYGGKVLRYRISADGIDGPDSLKSPGEKVTLAAGQAVAYLFQRTAVTVNSHH
jgi:hypothetical protein